MADNYLITGYWGEPHVTPENDRGINVGIFGTGRFVLPVGEQFKAEYIGNNTVRVYDGKLVNNGAAAGIPAGKYVDLLIPEAGQGMKRNDLIVFQYEKDVSTLVERGIFAVVKGEETSGTAADPALTQADILSGEANFDQMALWRVAVSGAVISTPVKLFSVATNAPDHIKNKNNPHNVTKAQVGLGNVQNVSTNNQTPTYSDATGLAELTSGEKLSVAFGKIAKAIADLISHIGNKSNPHGVTKSQVGLGNVDNTADSAKSVKTAESCTGNAATATKLATARTIRTNLASTGTASFDGSGNVTPGVTGTLPLGNGGTGATTAAAARTNLGITPANIGAATSSHNHDGTYLKYYDLNGCNIDSTAGVWTVDISETGHGTIPETWVNVTQFSGKHFLTQIAIKCENKSTTVRQGNRMWIRNRYNGGVWSTWMPIISLCSGSRGSSGSLTLPAGTITQITLDTWITGTDNSGFSFSGGGIKVPMDGIVLVSGAVYASCSTTDMYCGVYIYKGSREISSSWQWNRPVGAFSAPPAIVKVAAGDVIYLKARLGAAGTCAPNADGTHLDIMYV